MALLSTRPRARILILAAQTGRPSAQTVTCPNCGAPALPHMACPSCGAYRGRVYREAVRSIHTK